ncbi:enoyl-CoA hydratase/isomerase family protein [Kitasatospora sp. CM 4170]|uniref:3-hydroxyisobutyryl-CoA hydrolase n=1 Tax=Kitasatospora aburaviensis TaxID=67265 RepID=A0ABW1EYY0_9ACTN|nr:enoyl-CoA hydratase/isomerase family protein [Kitasatospora sp. CM 4170]WNM43500.1 enoyl-CoA hydratase/isomerase family protein [Kitasatospora sp. CM 4170]
MTGNTVDEVIVQREGRAGLIVLNRPAALNALTHGMVQRISEALDAWEQDERIETVVVTGAGDRAFCAGGDIVAIHRAATGGDPRAVEEFWRDEYRLNARIARYSKPYVAVMDGIVMGGGVGVSAHGSVRIVTGTTRVAMPEAGIGFVPDVGGTYLLALAPGELGTHLALTAGSVGGADALLCGLADHFVPAERLPALLDDLAELPVHDALERHVEPAPAGVLDGHRAWIDSCYAADTVAEILDRLRESGEPEAKKAVDRITANSPTAVTATLAALRRARALGPLEAVLDQEYRTSCAALSTPDLAEGIRAQVIDKDRTPRWSPATLSAVEPAAVARYFAPLGERELGLAAITPLERW